MDTFTSSQDGNGGSRPSLKYEKLIHFLKGEWHTSLRHTKKCMPAPAAATRAWSSNGSSRAAGLQGSPLPAYQHLSRSSCLFPRSQHTFGWGFSPSTQYPTLSRELTIGRQTELIQKWMPQLIVVSFHVLKREYARAQLLSWHSHIRGGK